MRRPPPQTERKAGEHPARHIGRVERAGGG